MCTLHKGVVTSYDAEKREGWLQLQETGERLPFSFTDGRCFTELDGGIDWLEARAMREPAKSDLVMVEVGRRGGQRTVRWGDAASYSIIERRLRSRAA